MAKLVTIQRSKNDNKPRARTGKARPPFGAAEGTLLGGLKPAYAVVAAVLALGCLYATTLHFRGVGGDNELSLSQARIQASHRRRFGGVGLSGRVSSDDRLRVGNR
jgi:hypothetical protein